MTSLIQKPEAATPKTERSWCALHLRPSCTCSIGTRYLRALDSNVQPAPEGGRVFENVLAEGTG